MEKNLKRGVCVCVCDSHSLGPVCRGLGVTLAALWSAQRLPFSALVKRDHGLHHTVCKASKNRKFTFSPRNTEREGERERAQYRSSLCHWDCFASLFAAEQLSSIHPQSNVCLLLVDNECEDSPSVSTLVM